MMTSSIWNAPRSPLYTCNDHGRDIDDHYLPWLPVETPLETGRRVGSNALVSEAGLVFIPVELF